MLRGLDAPTLPEMGHDPPVVKVADREPLDGTITVHARRGLSPAERARLREAVATVELLEESGLIETFRLERWPPLRAAGSAPGDRGHPYREHRAATGQKPFRSTRSDPGAADGDETVESPAIWVVIRAGAEIVGLYPHPTDDDRPTVRDCLVALSAGDPVANV